MELITIITTTITIFFKVARRMFRHVQFPQFHAIRRS